MTDTSLNKTIAFVSDKLSNEFQTTLHAFKALTWHQQVQKCLELMSLSMFDNLSSKEQELTAGSIAKSLGHETVGSFVLASHQNNGLEFNWDDWRIHAQAFRYFKEVNAQADTARQLIEDYANVSKHLGHKPVSTGEYARAMDSLKGKEHKDLEDKYRKTIHDMQEKHNEIFRCYNEERTSSSELKETVKKLNEKISTSRHENEKKLVNQEKDFRLENEKSINKERESFEREKAISLEEVEVKHLETVSNLQLEVESVKGKYTEDNFVPVQLYQEQSGVLERFTIRDLEQKDEIGSLNYKISEDSKTFDIVQNENGMQQDQIDILSKRIESFSTLYSQNVSPEGYLALRQEVNTLQSYLRTGKTKYQFAMNEKTLTAKLNKKLMSKIHQLITKNKLLNKKLKVANITQKGHIVVLGREKVKFQVAISALTIGTVLHFLIM